MADVEECTTKDMSISTGKLHTLLLLFPLHIAHTPTPNTHFNRNRETRTTPTIRDDDFVQKAVSMASKNSPCVGHKTAPLLSKWIGYSWIRFNVPELIHGIFFSFLSYYFIL